MNAQGNKTIGKTKKYDGFTRKQISNIIKREWSAVKETHPSSDEFAEKALQTLVNAGVKSPDGSPLNIRGVKYQVQRTGIKFKGRMTRLRKKGIQLPIETPMVRNEIVQTLSKVPLALKGILEDQTLNPKQRTAMFEAYFELNK